MAYSKISTLESRFKKLRIRMQDTPDTFGRKLYPERKSCEFKTIRICGERGLRKKLCRSLCLDQSERQPLFTSDLVNNVSCPPFHEIKRHKIEIHGGMRRGVVLGWVFLWTARPQRRGLQFPPKKYPTSKLFNYGERSEKRGNAGASGLKDGGKG